MAHCDVPPARHVFIHQELCGCCQVSYGYPAIATWCSDSQCDQNTSKMNRLGRGTLLRGQQGTEYCKIVSLLGLSSHSLNLGCLGFPVLDRRRCCLLPAAVVFLSQMDPQAQDATSRAAGMLLAFLSFTAVLGFTASFVWRAGGCRSPFFACLALFPAVIRAMVLHVQSPKNPDPPDMIGSKAVAIDFVTQQRQPAVQPLQQDG